MTGVRTDEVLPAWGTSRPRGTPSRVSTGARMELEDGGHCRPSIGLAELLGRREDVADLECVTGLRLAGLR